MEQVAAIRVLCVDDNQLVCDALRVALRLAGGFEWLGTAGCADGLAGEIRQKRPEVVVLDLNMPGTDPLQAIREVAAEFPDTRVVVYTGHMGPEMVDAALEAGAWGYVAKGERTGAIVDAIRMVREGKVAVFAGRAGLTPIWEVRGVVPGRDAAPSGAARAQEPRAPGGTGRTRQNGASKAASRGAEQ